MRELPYKVRSYPQIVSFSNRMTNVILFSFLSLLSLLFPGLVDFIKENVPEPEWEYTPIWLKATAGLRLLPESESNAIIDSVREFLVDKSKTPFVFHPHFARVISGNEEGGLGWISYNYMKKIIGPKRQSGTKPYAVVEMGGASSQVSQVAPSDADAALIPQEYKFSFNIEGQSYHLYTHSYLGNHHNQSIFILSHVPLTSSINLSLPSIYYISPVML